MSNIFKRGLVPSQLLIISITAIIMGLLLYFGYKWTIDLRERSNQVLLIQFKTQLNKDVGEIKTKYGAEDSVEYKLPVGFDEVCFVDLENIDENEIIDRPLILESVKSGAKQNLFLLGDNNFETYYIEGMQLSDYPYYSCIKQKIGNVELRILGRGDAAVIQTPPYERYCQNANEAVPSLCEGLDLVFGEGYREGCCQEYKLCC